jgi:hypothetical protein
MSRPILAASFLAVALLASAGGATAETRGLVLGVGAGVASIDLSLLDERKIGMSSNLELAWAVKENLLLGFRGDLWRAEVEGVTTLVHIEGFSTTWFPRGPSWFIFGSAGSGNLRLSEEGDTASDSGFGAVGGVGYEIPIGASLRLAPRVDAAYVDVDGADVNVVELSLGLIWDL